MNQNSSESTYHSLDIKYNTWKNIYNVTETITNLFFYYLKNHIILPFQLPSIPVRAHISYLWLFIIRCWGMVIYDNN